MDLYHEAVAINKPNRTSQSLKYKSFRVAVFGCEFRKTESHDHNDEPVDSHYTTY